MENCKLYLILDRAVNPYDELLDILKKSVAAGVDIVQLRDKNGAAKDILEFSRHAIRFIDGRIPFIVNDRVDLALAACADGVHLGQDDLPIGKARIITGSRLLIGTSCQSVEHVQKVQGEGADYIGLGSVFKTLTKPNRQPMDLNVLRSVCMKSSLPVFAIGGISIDNIEQVCEQGIDRVAVCRDICGSSDISNRVKQFKRILNASGNKEEVILNSS